VRRQIVLLLIAGIVLIAAAPASAGAATCRQGDPPITVSARTSCALAGGFVTAWMNRAPDDRPVTRTFRVHSPVTGRCYPITGTSRGRAGYMLVTGRGPNGIWLRFRQY
jgi:hypothetical protein